MRPIERFSNRVEDYVRYRPHYPDALLEVLVEHCGLLPSHVIADVGSGTGFLSDLFLRNGNLVHAVEPNGPMRAAGEAACGHYPLFHSIDASAEATGLGDASVDFVVAGQAFHWFDAAAAATEFRRIMRAGGWTVLVWNERPNHGGDFQAAYEDLLLDHAIDYATVDHRQIDASRIQAFFGTGTVTRLVLENSQALDREGLAGRIRSCSYVPAPGAPGFDAMMAGANTIFDQFQQEGRVTILYDTTVYLGQFGDGA
jgi:SAM-dependent methyltransferase